MLAILLVLAAASAPPVVAMSAAQLISTVNGSWTTSGEPAFGELGPAADNGRGVCSGPSLCILLAGGLGRVESITLTGPAETQAASGRYLGVQSLLIELTAPGAPMRLALTADRLAVGDGRPTEAQLGLTCMRVAMSSPRTITTTFSHRRCSVDR